MKRKIAKLIRFTEDEYEKLKERAAKTGLSQEAYMRSLLDGETPKNIPPQEYFELISKLNEYGKAIKFIEEQAQKTGFSFSENYGTDYKKFMETVFEIQKSVTQPARLKYGDD